MGPPPPLPSPAPPCGAGHPHHQKPERNQFITSWQPSDSVCRKREICPRPPTTTPSCTPPPPAREGARHRTHCTSPCGCAGVRRGPPHALAHPPPRRFAHNAPRPQGGGGRGQQLFLGPFGSRVDPSGPFGIPRTPLKRGAGSGLEWGAKWVANVFPLNRFRSVGAAGHQCAACVRHSLSVTSARRNAEQHRAPSRAPLGRARPRPMSQSVAVPPSRSRPIARPRAAGPPPTGRSAVVAPGQGTGPRSCPRGRPPLPQAQDDGVVPEALPLLPLRVR